MLGLHIRIVSNFVLKFVVVGLPAFGMIMAESYRWNIIWGAAYLAWGLYFVKDEIVTKTVIGTMWVQLPFVILIEMRVVDFLYWTGASIWAVLSYLVMYKQEIDARTP